ncbi:MAG: hypothetical protein ABIH00_03000 [Armatimonadota bacterium]
MPEAKFVELTVSLRNIRSIEARSDELGSFLMGKSISKGKIIRFSGINLKVTNLEPSNEGTITENTEISIIPDKEELKSSPEKEKEKDTGKEKKKIMPLITSLISIILVLSGIFIIAKAVLQSDYIKNLGIFKKDKVKSSTHILSNEELAELMYPGKVISNFTVDANSQATVNMYRGCPAFYIKTKSYYDVDTGHSGNMNTIAIVGKEYADITGDGKDELVVVSIGDDKILPDCMASRSANNVIIYKWDGSRYEEIWRNSMDLGQEGYFESLEIADSNNNRQPEIRLYGTYFTHGEAEKFCDAYEWDGHAFIPVR